MFIRRFLFEDGTSFYRRGYVEHDETEHSIEVQPTPTGPAPVKRIQARVQVNCDNNEAGVRAAAAVIRSLLTEVEQRIQQGKWDAQQ